MSVTTYQPDPLAFFPKLRRGHGFGTHKGDCAAEGCRPGSRTKHWSQMDNVKDWEEERGVRLFNGQDD